MKKERLVALLLFISINMLFGLKTISQTNKGEKIYLKIYYREATVKDTLTISIGNNMLDDLNGLGGGDKRSKYKSVLNNDGCFTFEIPIYRSCGYFDIIKNRILGEFAHSNVIAIVTSQFWEAGDNITIHLSFTEKGLGGNADCNFSGKGSEKYELVNNFNHFKPFLKGIPILNESWPSDWDGNILEYDKFDAISSITSAKLNLLETFKSKLTTNAYYVLKGNIIYSSKSGFFSKVESFGRKSGLSKLDNLTRKAYLKRFNCSFDFPDNYKIDNKYLINSLDYLYFLRNKLQAASALYTGFYSPEWIYEGIKKYNTSNDIKEVLIIKELSSSRLYPENLAWYYNDARQIIRDSIYLKLLEELERRTPGRKFTDFQLKDLNGNIKTLESYKGKIVLMDFWFTGCGYCEIYYKNVLSKVEEKLKSNPKVVFLSISIDKDEKLWKRSINEGNYTSKEAENLYTNGLRENHPIIKFNNITGYPCIILLDRDGRIILYNSNNLRDEKSILTSIMALM